MTKKLLPRLLAVGLVIGIIVFSSFPQLQAQNIICGCYDCIWACYCYASRCSCGFSGCPGYGTCIIDGHGTYAPCDDSL
jgi:hypothetical protein